MKSVFFLSNLLAAALLAPAGPGSAFASPVLFHQESSLLEDKPEWLPADRKPTEAESDRSEAKQLFAVGRFLELEQDYSGALRKYQRAFRCDPQATTICDAAIETAYRLRRFSEAVRYVALRGTAHPETSDAALMRSLGAMLAEVGDWEHAAGAYEIAAADRRGEKPTADDLLLQMDLGRLYHLIGKNQQAADHFAQVVAGLDHPEKFAMDQAAKARFLKEQGPTYALFGESFLLANRLAEAAAAFQQADELPPKGVLRGYHQALLAARAKKPAEALDRLQDYFDRRLSIEAEVPYQLLAEVLKDLGKQAELRPRLEKLRAADQDNVPLGYFLADQYRQQSQWDKAEPLYAALLKKVPLTAGYRGLAEIYRKTRRPGALLQLLGDVAAKDLSLEPVAAQCRALRGDAALLGAVLEAARKRTKDDSHKPAFGMSLAAGLLCLDDQRFAAAGQFLAMAETAEPKHAVDILLVWGVTLLAADRAKEAVVVFQRAERELSQHPEDKALAKGAAAVAYHLAGALEMAGRTDEALAVARAAAQAKDSPPRMAGRVAWVLLHAKRFKDAGQAYRALLEKYAGDYNSDEVREVVRETKLVLSSLPDVEGTPAGDEWLQQVLDEFPDDVSAMNDLGYLWADRGVHLQRALRMIQRAVAEEPKNDAYRDSLGWVLFRLGRFPEALAQLEKAAAVEKPDAVVLDHFGGVCAKTGQPDKARQACAAVELFKADNQPDKAKRTEAKLNAK